VRGTAIVVVENHLLSLNCRRLLFAVLVSETGNIDADSPLSV
jgi:hypothetical protein